MQDKSYVSLEQHVCILCGKTFDTGALLFDTRMRPCFDRCTTTGWDLCSEHKELFDEGYVALVECDPELSALSDNDTTLKPEAAYRTGCIAHLKRKNFSQLFNVPITDDTSCVFVEKGVLEHLSTMVQS